MKARLQQLGARIDALSQRERILSFLAGAALIVFGVQAAVLAPLARKEGALQDQIGQQRKSLASIDAAIAEQAAAFAVDPDRPLREQLQGVEHEVDRLSDQMRTMERGLVMPERMAPLLETMLRANPRLRLVSMKTLAVTPVREPGQEAATPATLSGSPATPGRPADDGAAMAQSMIANAARASQPAQATPAAAPGAASASAPAGAATAPAQGAATPPAPGAPTPGAPTPGAPNLLFRHGVELTVRGSYLDLVDYMTTLEHLPTQLFWGKARLEVESYPNVRLTLTLYTLSLDTKWMKL